MMETRSRLAFLAIALALLVVNENIDALPAQTKPKEENVDAPPAQTEPKKDAVVEPVNIGKLIVAQLRVKSKIDMIKGSVTNILQLGDDYVEQAKSRAVDQSSITAISELLSDARAMLNEVTKKDIAMTVAMSSDKSNEAKMVVIKKIEVEVDEKTNNVQKDIFDPIKVLLAKANAEPDFGDNKIARILYRLKKDMEDICEDNLKERIKQDVSDLEQEIDECHAKEDDEEKEVEEKIEEEEEKVEKKKEEIEKTDDTLKEELEEEENAEPTTEASGEEITKSPEEIEEEVTELLDDSEDMVEKADDVAEKCPEK